MTQLTKQEFANAVVFRVESRWPRWPVNVAACAVAASAYFYRHDTELLLAAAGAILVLWLVGLRLRPRVLTMSDTHLIADTGGRRFTAKKQAFEAVEVDGRTLVLRAGTHTVRFGRGLSPDHLTQLADDIHAWASAPALTTSR